MTYSDLDDLKATWQTLSQKLDRQHAFALQQVREKKLTRFRGGFRLLVTGQIFQIIAGALLALWGGSFWVDHLGVLHLMIEGILIHVYGLMLIIFASRDLFLVRQFDYAAPVLTLQKQIGDLRAWHRIAALWFGLTGCFIWIPALLMIFQKLGADVWLHHPEVIGWFLLSALVSLAIFWGVIAFSRRPGRERFARSLENSTAGWSVQRAESLLEEIERFENDRRA